MDFNKKGKREFFNEKLLFKTVGIIFLIVILLLILADFKIYQKKKELNSQISAFKKQIESIEKSSQNLKNEIANSDNKDYLEKLAYEQLGQAKPGEKVYSFIGLQEKAKVAPSPKNFWFGWISGVWGWIKARF